MGVWFLKLLKKMFEISVGTQSRYQVDKEKIKLIVEKTLLSRGIKDDTAVSVFICGRRKMRELSRRYLRKAEDHNVLSFVYTEVNTQFVEYPDNLFRLGDIIVCYPLALNQAMEENKMVDDVVCELVEHGVLHLLGEHHEDH